MTSSFEEKILKVKTALENVFIKKSNTNGLVKNDGTIDTNSYSKTNHTHSSLYQYKTIADTNSVNLNDDIFKTPDIYAISSNESKTLLNRPLPDSLTYNKHARLEIRHYKNGTIYNYLQIYYVFPDGSENIFYRTWNNSGWNDWIQIAKVNDIPTKISDLTNDSDFIETSNTAGLIKNDGTIDISNYSTFSGSYNDLTNKPNIPSKRVFYGTCGTQASTQRKIIITDEDFQFIEGTILIVKCTNAQTYNASETDKLEIGINSDTTNIKNLLRLSSYEVRYCWGAGETIILLYNGTNFELIDDGRASTTYYGVTKLSNSTTSTSTSLSATPLAVKTVADAKADKTDGVSQITDSNASGYSNISSSLTSSSTQADINSAINTELGDISNMIGDAISYINQ